MPPAMPPVMPPANETIVNNLQNHSQPSFSRTSSEAPTYLRPTTPSSVHSSSSETGDNDIIPPYDPHAPRTLVLCFDGTGDQFDADNSNVVKFFSLLKRDDRREQMVYYQTGIGTYTSPQLVTSAGQAISKTLDQMVAWNLDMHVMGGYEFLMQNYEAGDKICLFGFSRGAYTARALAGMLHKVGLLPAHNRQQIPFAYKMYSRTDEVGWLQSTAFKKAFSIDVDIDFIGVWDTVCSVGVIPHRLPFTASNTAIRTFRHALSLDERRAKFKANHWQRPSTWEAHQGTHPGDMPRPHMRHASTTKTRRSSTRSNQSHSRSNSGAKPMSPSRLASLTKHLKEQTDATVVAGATASAGTSKDGGSGAVTAGVSVENESEGDKKAEVVVETVSSSAEAAVDAAEKVADEVAAAAGEAGRKLWTEARSRFGTLRTLMRKKGKRMTEEEQAFNRAQQELSSSALPAPETDVKEVWFAGCHSDVGGGSVRDEEKHSLARIPLRWMIRECFRTNTGIRFHAELLKDIGLDPATLWPHARVGVEFGPGLAHAPQIPPIAPSPRISEAFDPPHPPTQMHAQMQQVGPRIALNPPTPMELSREDVERRVLHAMSTPSGAVHATLTSNAPCPPPASRFAEHARHVSVSTTRTLVGTMSCPGAGGEKAPLHTEPLEMPVDEEGEEVRDATCQVYDQLSLKWWWWIVELIPIEQRRQLSDDEWTRYMSFNRGRGRKMPPGMDRPLVHKSVKLRMEHVPKYMPKVREWASLNPIWVD